jgi:hypothetical protein
MRRKHTATRTATRRAIAAAAALGLGTVLTAPTACDDPGTVEGIHVDSAVVRSSSVQPDPARTWEHDLAEVRPDSALASLWRAGLPVEVAWRPLDYRCEDPRGGRLTVQLTDADGRMADHGFRPGTGRLACSEELMRYLVVRVEG